MVMGKRSHLGEVGYIRFVELHYCVFNFLYFQAATAPLIFQVNRCTMKPDLVLPTMSLNSRR